MDSTARYDPYYHCIKPGFQFKDSIDLTSFALDDGVYYNFDEDDDKGTTYAASVVQNIRGIHMDLDASYRIFEFDRTEEERFDGIYLFATGARYTF